MHLCKVLKHIKNRSIISNLAMGWGMENHFRMFLLLSIQIWITKNFKNITIKRTIHLKTHLMQVRALLNYKALMDHRILSFPKDNRIITYFRNKTNKMNTISKNNKVTCYKSYCLKINSWNSNYKTHRVSDNIH
jgi:hypothetical protein